MVGLLMKCSRQLQRDVSWALVGLSHGQALCAKSWPCVSVTIGADPWSHLYTIGDVL